MNNQTERRKIMNERFEQSVQQLLDQLTADYSAESLRKEVLETLLPAFQRCAALCEIGGDETLSYQNFTLASNFISRRLSDL